MSDYSQDTHEGLPGFPNNFKDLPNPYDTVKKILVKRVLHEDLNHFYGLSDEVPFYRVYHATVTSKLPLIAREGLRAFYEEKANKPRIFVTPSPTVALWHAIENKPHDTLRRKGQLPEAAAEGDPVLLQLQLDKNWLSGHPDLTKPLDQVEYVTLLAYEISVGTRKHSELTRMHNFADILRAEVNDLKLGKEAPNVGLPLPVDHVPPKMIFMDTFDSLTPLQIIDLPIKA